jgi:hypothetical protein
MPPSDTSPDAQRFLLDALRTRPPAERLEMVDRLIGLARQAAEAAYRRDHPGCSELEVRADIARRLLGPELAEKVMAEITRRRSGSN